MASIVTVTAVTSLQGRMAKLLEAVDNGEGYKMTSYAADGLWKARNKCGHSLLHRALLSRPLGRTLVDQILEAYPALCHFTDNVRAWSLDYAGSVRWQHFVVFHIRLGDLYQCCHQVILSPE